MADAMEDAYARGLEAGKAMKAKEVKDEECLDLDQRDEDGNILTFFITSLGLCILLFAGILILRYCFGQELSPEHPFTEIYMFWQNFLVSLLVVVFPLSLLSGVESISRKKKNRANQK